MFVAGGMLSGQRKIGATKTTLFSIPYDSTNHRFFRIRHDSLTNSLVMDTASSNAGVPGPWVQRFTETWNASISLSSFTFEVKGGTSLAETNAPGKVIWDNFRAARFHTLAENFDDNSLDNANWTLLNPGSATAVREISQQLQITLQPNTVGYFGVLSTPTFDLSDRTVQAEIVQPISQAGWTEQYFQIEKDSDNYYQISAGAGAFVMDAVTAGVRDRTIVTFNQAEFRFWRFRHNTTGNTLSFETSSNGQNWTTRKTVTVGFPLDSMYITLQAGAFGAENSFHAT